MKKILYLGLDPSRYECEGKLVHFPIIKTTPRPFEGHIKKLFEELATTTHVIVTSRTAASLFCEYAEKGQQALAEKIFLSIGDATATLLRKRGLVTHIAPQATGEGIIELLKIVPKPGHVFYPHSALARPLIKNYLKQQGIPFTAVDLYDASPRHTELPDLDSFDKIIFTSPSTVAAFFSSTAQMPPREKCISIGPITAQALEDHFSSTENF